MSNNKMFKRYMRQMSDQLKQIDPKFTFSEDFIIKCRNDWKSMSENERNVWMKSNHFIRIKEEEVKRQEEMSRKECTQPTEHHFQQKLIDCLVGFKSKEELMSTDFYLMSSNVMCVVNDTYIPLELAFVKYSIRDGIHGSYHSFISCGDIPYGYAFAAINHMKTHKIPLNDFKLASNDYQSIGNEILDFLEESRFKGKYTEDSKNHFIIFSMDEQTEQNAGALKWISKKHKTKDNEWNYMVLPVSGLLYSLYTIAGSIHEEMVCRDEMTGHTFDYSYNTDCNYHSELGSIDCALGVAKRMAYTLSDRMFRVLKFKVNDNHFPSPEYHHKYSCLGLIQNIQNLQITDKEHRTQEPAVLEYSEDVKFEPKVERLI